VIAALRLERQVFSQKSGKNSGSDPGGNDGPLAWQRRMRCFDASQGRSRYGETRSLKMPE
jgi:hypothetical protein